MKFNLSFLCFMVNPWFEISLCFLKQVQVADLYNSPPIYINISTWGQTTSLRIAICSARLSSPNRRVTRSPTAAWHSSQVTALLSAETAEMAAMARMRNFMMVTAVDVEHNYRKCLVFRHWYNELYLLSDLNDSHKDKISVHILFHESISNFY